jgi:hypothetical protein
MRLNVPSFAQSVSLSDRDQADHNSSDKIGSRLGAKRLCATGHGKSPLLSGQTTRIFGIGVVVAPIPVTR